MIRGHLELTSDVPDERRRRMELVSEDLDRMRRMVDDLSRWPAPSTPDLLRLLVVDADELTERMLQNAGDSGRGTGGWTRPRRRG